MKETRRDRKGRGEDGGWTERIVGGKGKEIVRRKKISRKGEGRS